MDDWYGPETATLGDRIAAARDAAGMSTEDMAKRLGVKKSTLRGWEEDLSEPRANKLQMMAGLLNVSVAWLLNGEGDGVDAPSETELMPADARDMLVEMRSLQSEMKSAADRLARLEKRLRHSLAEPA